MDAGMMVSSSGIRAGTDNVGTAMDHQGKEVLRMLQTSTEFRELRDGLASEITNPIDLEQLFAIVRRQWRVVAGFAVAAILVGGLFLLVATPKFTSTAGILIDESNQKIVDQMSAVTGVLEDEGQVLSQVELL